MKLFGCLSRCPRVHSPSPQGKTKSPWNFQNYLFHCKLSGVPYSILLNLNFWTNLRDQIKSRLGETFITHWRRMESKIGVSTLTMIHEFTHIHCQINELSNTFTEFPNVSRSNPTPSGISHRPSTCTSSFVKCRSLNAPLKEVLSAPLRTSLLRGPVTTTAAPPLNALSPNPPWRTPR